jgi:hypothetical protein
MLLGIVAIGEGGEQAGSGPASLLASADFVNHVYSYGASTLTAGQVVNQTGWITGNGLEIPSAAGAAAHVLNQFATELLTCNWTLVIEANILVSSNISPASNLLSVYNNPTDLHEMGLDVSSQQNWFITDHDDALAVTRYTDDSTDNDSGGTADTTGIHRYAVTRTNGKLAASVDGYSVTTDTTALTLPNLTYPMDRVYLGGYYNATGRAVYIRLLQIYNPVSDASLPTLSTP